MTIHRKLEKGADAATEQVYQQAGLASKSVPPSPRGESMVQRQRHIQQEGCAHDTAHTFRGCCWVHRRHSLGDHTVQKSRAVARGAAPIGDPRGIPLSL